MSERPTQQSEVDHYLPGLSIMEPTEQASDTLETPVEVLGVASEQQGLDLRVSWHQREASYHRARVGEDGERIASHNEDTILHDDLNGLFGIFDGAGGEANAKEASASAAEAIHEWFSESAVQAELESPSLTKAQAINVMKHAFLVARSRVAAHAEGGVTTAAVVKIITIDGKKHALIGNAGDSRILMDPVPGGAANPATMAKIAKNPNRPDLRYELVADQSTGHVVHNAISAHDLDGSADEYKVIPLDKEARLVICSDGITGDTQEQFLTATELVTAFSKDTAFDAMRAFMNASKKDDDKSILVIDIHPTTATEASATQATAAASSPKATSFTSLGARLDARLAAAATVPKPAAAPNVLNRSPLEVARDVHQTLETREAERAQLNEYRDEYVRLIAGRSRRAFSKKYSSAAVLEARQRYTDYRDNIYGTELELLHQLNVEPEMIDMAMAAAAFGEERLLAKRLHDFRLTATGNYQFNDAVRESGGRKIELQEGNVELTSHGRTGRIMNKFYEWYGGVNAGAKQGIAGRAKKAGVMAGAGLAIGAGVSVLAPVTAGVMVAGASGALIANRITKAYMTTRFKRKGEDAGIGRHAEARRLELLRQLGNGTTGLAMTALIEQQTSKEVRRNRIRTGALVGTTVVAGFAGAELVDHFTSPNIDIDVPAEDDNVPSSKPDQPPEKPVKPEGDNEPTGSQDDGTRQRNKTRGFTTRNITIEDGNGMTHELQDLLAQKDVELTPDQSYDMYQHLMQQFPDGNFFTNVDEYEMENGDVGVSKSGRARWSPRVLKAIDEYSKSKKLY